jgi:hypothetical protein
MEKLTVKEALEKGYTHCGYEDLTEQMLMPISQIDDDNFDFAQGRIMVADKELHSVTIDADDIVSLLSDHFYNVDENPHTDDDIEDYLKEEKELLSEFATKINEIYKKKTWQYLSHSIQLVKDSDAEIKI